MKFVFPFLLVSLVVGVTGEITLRVAGYLRPIPALETIKYGRLLKETPTDSEPFPLHKHLRTETIMGKVIHTDERGLRIKPQTDSKTAQPKDKILVLGSSVALGWGVEAWETFSEQVAKKFSPFLSQPLQGLNAGIANSNTEYHLGVLKTQLPLQKPKMVLLVYYLADAIPQPKVETSNLRLLMSRSMLLSYFQIWSSRLQFLLTTGGGNHVEFFQNYYRADSEEWLNVQRDLKSMQQVCDENKIPFIVIPYPDTHDLRPDNPYEKIYQTLQKFLSTNGIRYLDGVAQSLHQFGGREKDLWVTPDDPHGNSAVVEILVDQMINKKFYQLLSPTL